jgi:rhodanese-related sulfurtransferase
MKTLKIMSVFSLVVVLTVSAANAAVITIPADTLGKWITSGTQFDFLLIDVRDPSELSSIIATSLCSPYNLSWNQGVFASTMNKLPKNANYVVYCQSGHRGGMAAQLLVDSGYVSVYSLVNGMNGWTGPTKTSASLKPVSDLPGPSMLKALSGVLLAVVKSDRAINLVETSRGFSINAPLAANHLLTIYNVRGQCVLEAQNPFIVSKLFVMPKDLSKAKYIARITTHNQP